MLFTFDSVQIHRSSSTPAAPRREDLTWCEPSASTLTNNVPLGQPEVLCGCHFMPYSQEQGSWYRNRRVLAGDRDEVISYRSFLMLSLLRRAKGNSAQS